MSDGGPVFTGGSGRSGTTVLSHLLDAHADLVRVVPTEVRFLTDHGGLIDLLEASRDHRIGRRPWRLLPDRWRGTRGVTAASFARRLRTHWYHRVGRDGLVRGLHRGGLEVATVERLLDGFEDRFRRDPRSAARDVATGIMVALAHGSPRWVETTPGNALRPAGLLDLFPAMHLLHIVRDGRDTAASVATRSWGPNDLFGALDWWADRMTRAYTALEGFDPQRALTIRLEDLVLRDREATYERIRTFLELPPDDGMRAFFDTRLTPERGHLGRWRRQLPGAADAERFDARYRDHLVALRDRFGPVPPTEDLELPRAGRPGEDADR
jgi:hypothetical protein